jgi:hypothetical protein
MYAVLSGDDGKTFAPPQKLGTGTWKLNGCPMDGGSIAFDLDGKVLAAWRREKTVFSSESNKPEEVLSDSALQPLVIPIRGGAYLWESGGALMLKKGNGAPARFADKGKFAAVAPLPKHGAVVVWESQANGKNTLLSEVIE